MDPATIPTDVEEDLLERVESRGDTSKNGSYFWLRVGQIRITVWSIVYVYGRSGSFEALVLRLITEFLLFLPQPWLAVKFVK